MLGGGRLDQEILRSFKWVIIVVRMYTGSVENADKINGQVQEIL